MNPSPIIIITTAAFKYFCFSWWFSLDILTIKTKIWCLLNFEVWNNHWLLSYFSCLEKLQNMISFLNLSFLNCVNSIAVVFFYSFSLTLTNLYLTVILQNYFCLKTTKWCSFIPQAHKNDWTSRKAYFKQNSS